MSERKDGGAAFPTITIFQGRTNMFGKSLEQECTVNPDNLHPFTKRGYYGLCTACGADLHEGDWYERVNPRGHRYWCGDCVEEILQRGHALDLAARQEDRDDG